MTLSIVLLILCISVFILLIIFRNNLLVKKYWRYSLVLIPAIVLLILKIIASSKKSNNTTTVPLKDDISNIKNQLQEINTIVKVEAAIAKTKNDTKIEELKEVQKIPDDQERRKRLAQMIG